MVHEMIFEKSVSKFCFQPALTPDPLSRFRASGRGEKEEAGEELKKEKR
jgi:hypothetical protein